MFFLEPVFAYTNGLTLEHLMPQKLINTSEVCSKFPWYEHLENQ